MPNFFRQPKKRTLKGKSYLIFGKTEGAAPLAIAQFKSKYGWKDVKNLAIRRELAKKV